MTAPSVVRGPTDGSIGDDDRGPPRTTTRSLTATLLTRDWYARPVLTVARELLGMFVMRQTPEGVQAWRIVEVEAYDGPQDRASHARVGRTPRTAPMFGPPGHAYVYLVYGMHHCLNVVAHLDGAASAVLIRALEPLPTALRSEVQNHSPRPHRIAAGPGLVGRALALDRSMSGHDLTLGQGLWLEAGTPIPHERLVTGPRIGVAYAGPDWADLPWRFGDRESSALSRPFPRTTAQR